MMYKESSVIQGTNQLNIFIQYAYDYFYSIGFVPDGQFITVDNTEDHTSIVVMVKLHVVY